MFLMLLIAFSVTSCSTDKRISKAKQKEHNMVYSCAKW